MLTRLTFRPPRHKQHHKTLNHPQTHLSHLHRPLPPLVPRAARTCSYGNTSLSLGGPQSTNFAISALHLIHIAVFVTNGWLTPLSSRFISSAFTEICGNATTRTPPRPVSFFGRS